MIDISTNINDILRKVFAKRLNELSCSYSFICSDWSKHIECLLGLNDKRGPMLHELQVMTANHFKEGFCRVGVEPFYRNLHETSEDIARSILWEFESNVIDIWNNTCGSTSEWRDIINILGDPLERLLRDIELLTNREEENVKIHNNSCKELLEKVNNISFFSNMIFGTKDTILKQYIKSLTELYVSKTHVVALTVEQEIVKKMIDNEKDTFYNIHYSSIFAPAETKRESHMLVQVYLHLFGETETVKALAQESDKDAERRDNIPLQCKLKKGDKVDVLLNIYGETLLMSEKKSVVWQDSFTKCSFDYFVSKYIDVDELSCVALLSVNGVPVGEMRFITKIVEHPRKLNPEIIAHKYSKVFISYSHQDESKVKFLHEGLKIAGTEHFFDRDYLTIGDVFPQVIRDYINSADLFILCWSENASKSEYVQKERLQALERAFPQVKPEQEAKLRIYPMSIEPRAELPSDMKENYHFGVI